MEIIALLAVFVAFFVKGFSGFGPALVLIPSLTLLYDPETAITASALFDLIAGPILFVSVRKRIDWKFVISVVIFLFVGAYFGALLLQSFSTEILKRIIAVGLMVFIIILILQKKQTDIQVSTNKRMKMLRYPIALISGFSGGLIGISGPLLVVYMKLIYKKIYFRDQLIAIFMLGAGWRLLLYRSYQIKFNLDWITLGLMICFLLIGLWLGKRYHSKVNERKFNRIVALILLIPTINLLIF